MNIKYIIISAVLFALAILIYNALPDMILGNQALYTISGLLILIGVIYLFVSGVIK